MSGTRIRAHAAEPRACGLLAPTARRAGALPAAALGLALFAGLAALARSWSFPVPLSEDTGVYLYAGEVILDGGTPYVDVADNKGPLTYVLFAGVKLVSGTGTTAVRLTLLLFAALTALALAAWVARHAGRAAGALAGALFAVVGSTEVLEGPDPNTEQYGVAPMSAAWWLSARGTRGSAALAGALVSAAALINPGFVAVAPVIALGLWLEGPAHERARRLAAALGGGVAAALPFALWLGAAGALDDMWTQVVGKASSAVAGDGGAFAGGGLFDFTGRGLYLLGVAGAALALVDARLRPAGAASLTWIVLMWLRVKLSSYEFDHHYHLGLPGIAAGLALGAAAAYRLASRPLRPLAAGAAAVLFGLVAWKYVAHDWLDRYDRPPAERVRFPNYALAYPVADFIREHTGPADEIIVGGNNPTVYWRAERRASTRFIAEYPLVEPRYRDERRRELAADPPQAIAVFPIGDVYVTDVPELARGPGYRLAWERDGARVWLRGR